MGSAQISPLFQIKREESWCSRISGWKLSFFESPTRKLLLIRTFLQNKTCLSAKTISIKPLIYVKAIYGQKTWKKSIFHSLYINCHLLNTRYFLTTGSLLS